MTTSPSGLWSILSMPLGPREVRRIRATARPAEMLAFCASRPRRRDFCSCSLRMMKGLPYSSKANAMAAASPPLPQRMERVKEIYRDAAAAEKGKWRALFRERSRFESKQWRWSPAVMLHLPFILPRDLVYFIKLVVDPDTVRTADCVSIFLIVNLV